MPNMQPQQHSNDCAMSDYARMTLERSRMGLSFLG